MFAADAAVQVAVCALAERDCHLHEFADADSVKTCKRIGLIDLCLIVTGQELACVVTAEAEGKLGEVVGAEAEEFGFFCNFVRGERCPWDFDHGADFVFEIDACFLDNCVCGFDNGLLAEHEFFDFADERDHDFRNDVPVRMTLFHCDGGLDDSLGLHNGNFRIGNCQTATAVAHHRVEFVQAVAKKFDFLNGFALCFCKFCDVLFFGRNEFVERRIQETNGDRHAFECFHQAFEVCLLHGLDCRKCFDAFFNGLGANHFTEFIYSARSEEHVFGTNKTDTLCAEFRCALCVLRSIRIGANAECFVLVCEFHDSSEITAVGVCKNRV